jgi:hypothetical protein
MKIKHKGNTMAAPVVKAGATTATGIKVINSQGTQIVVLPKGTDISDCDKLATAYGTGSRVGCIQSIGSLGETRASTEYKCLSSNESVKALGAISRGSLEIGLLLDPDDKTGQQALRQAFKDNEGVIIVIELPNKPASSGSGTVTKAGHGTLWYFNASVSGVSSEISMDSAIMYNVTLEIGGEIKECPAVADTI